MTFRTALRSALALLAVLACTAPQAQVFRAYLSIDGSDANPCTLTQPCRLLPAALNAVMSGGEIWMLDSANYNTAGVTIGKSVTVVAVPGAIGSILSLNYQSAVLITTPGLKVTLRNVVIGPLPGSNTWHGVELNAASTLIIEKSVIANVAYNGVAVAGGRVEIIDSVIRNNSGYGIILFDGSNAQITGTQVLKNFAGGIYAVAYGATTVRATVNDSVVTGIASDADAGIYVNADVSGADVRIYVTRTAVQETRYALRTSTGGSGTALIGVSYSMIANNAYGWYINSAGGMIRSGGNNHFTEGGFTGYGLTLTPLQ